MPALNQSSKPQFRQTRTRGNYAALVAEEYIQDAFKTSTLYYYLMNFCKTIYFDEYLAAHFFNFN